MRRWRTRQTRPRVMRVSLRWRLLTLGAAHALSFGAGDRSARCVRLHCSVQLASVPPFAACPAAASH